MSSRRVAKRAAVVSLLTLAFLPAVATGETPKQSEEAEDAAAFRGPPQEPSWKLDLYQRVKLRADLDKGDASLAVYRTGGSAGVGKFFGYIRLGFRVSGERNVYDLSGAERINTPPDTPALKDPWNVLSLTRFNLSVLVPLGRSNWSVFAFGGIRIGWESGAKLDDGLSGSFGVSVGYRIDGTLSIQVGFLLVTRIEDSPFGFPIIGVRWNPTEWFRLESRGPGIEAGLKPIEELEITASVRYDNRQFRLDDRRSSLAEHILEDQEAVVELGVTWSPLEFLSLRGVVGLVAYQEFEVRDRRGDTRYRSRSDPAPTFELGLTLLF